MASDWEALTVISSVVLRAAAYIFLRWIPGHMAPPVIFASLVAYLIAWKKTLDRTAAVQLVAEERDRTVVNRDGKVIATEQDVIEYDEQGRAVAEVDTVAVDEDAAGEELREEAAAAAPRTAVLFEDELIFGARPPHILRSLLTGLPSPSSRLWNVVVVLMHVLPALFTADLVYRAPLLYPSHDLAFAKVGYVSDTSASILLREPNATQTPVLVSYMELGPVDHNLERQTGVKVKAWKEAGTLHGFSNQSDYAAPFTIKSLRPSTRYAWRASNGHNGTFTTAPKAGRFQPDGRAKFTFLSSSCIKARFPYYIFSHPLSVPGFQYLARTLDKLQPAFMLFLGDWVYVDVPRRLGDDVETYRREYRQTYASPDWPSVASLPWLHVIDDHEIANDWDKNTSDPYPAAIDAYDIYHGSVNPPAPPEPRGATWRVFTQGPASFFLMDTRQYRADDHMADGPGKTMLGDLQLYALLRWLEAPEPAGVHWKVVVSSIPFTVNWRINAQDTWAGFRHERRVILEKMWDVGASPSGVGVVVLSGDRHEFAATSFPPPQGGKWSVSATVHEFSCSPLSMFYLPFRTYWEDNDRAVAEGQEEDICIKYIPDGNSKFGAVEIEREVGGEQSRLHYRLFVNGKEAWSYGIMSPPQGRGPRGKDAVWA